MKTSRGAVAALFGLCLSGNMLAGSAEADPSVTDKSTAKQLFDEGRALLEQGRVSAACPKFEESQRLDPGGGTLLNLALCHERDGRTASAWVEFTEALGVAKRDGRAPRAEFARSHIAQLEPALSRITIAVPRASDTPDVEVRRDGSVVATAAWGSPVPVDPGDHLIEVTASGKVAWRQSVLVGPSGDAKTVVVPALQDAPAQSPGTAGPSVAAAAAAVAPKGATDANAESAATETATRGSSRPSSAAASVPAWIALGVGVAAAGGATYFALHAMSLKNDADGNCPNDRCTAQGASQNSDAIRSANFATVGYGVAALGMGLATVFFATHAGVGSSSVGANARPRGIVLTAGNVSAVPGGGAVTLGGRW